MLIFFVSTISLFSKTLRIYRYIYITSFGSKLIHFIHLLLCKTTAISVSVSGVGAFTPHQQLKLAISDLFIFMVHSLVVMNLSVSFHILQSNIKPENLTIALEPEAASVLCRHLPVDRLDTNSSVSSFSPGTKYMVLDAGGR